MNTTKLLLISALTGVVFGTSLLLVFPGETEVKVISQATIQNNDSQTRIFSKDTDLHIVSAEGLFSETFNTVEGMFEDAEIVAEVKVLDQQVYQRESFTVETLSQVEVIKLCKGDPQLTNLKVAEIGGPIDLTKEQLAYSDKPGSGNESAVNLERKMVESTLEGVPVIKKGNHYVVFLIKNYGSETYSPAGSVQGKIKLDKNMLKAVATVGPELINESIHFFQKEFAGKELAVLESRLQKLKDGK